MAFVAFAYEYDASVATAREWKGTICRSSGNIPAMYRSMYDVPSKNGTTKLSTTPQMIRACRCTKQTTSLMVPSLLIVWFEAEFRRNPTAVRMGFLHNGQKNDRSTKFWPAPVSNSETTGCKAV